MKKATLILSAAVLTVFSVCTLSGCKEKGTETETATVQAADGSIVYFNLDRVLNEYDMANDLRTVVENKAQSAGQEIQRRQNKLEKDIKAFQDKVNKGLLTSSVAQVQQEKLQKAQAEFEQYYAQKQQEMAEEQSVMMNQIADAIKTFIDNFNAEKGYAMILTTQGEIMPAPVVTADESLDITDAVLEGLNAEYVKTKAQKKD